jgi:hypothetical protein
MKLPINRSWATSLAIATILILSGVAGASNGVIEINQACAENTGCSSGDGAGFPVDLGGFGTPRSYILTSDLVPTNSGSTIFINGDNVTLDMNGFSILCSPSSTFGIRYGSPRKNLRVSNGTIRGCQSGGIAPGGAGGAHIDRVTVDSCLAGGIAVGNNSRVENSTVIDSATELTAYGISLAANSIAGNNVVSGARFGIFCGVGCLIKGNVVQDNFVGLWGVGSTIISNSATGNFEDGIRGYDGSNVISNTMRDNGQGLSLTTDASYRGNSILESASESIVGGFGINQGLNVCVGRAGYTACP